MCPTLSVSEQLIRSDFLHLFMVCRQNLILDTQNPKTSGYSTAHAYKYKTKRQAKVKWRQGKMRFC